MAYATLESGSLGDVDDSYYYGAYCPACKHHSRLSLVELRKYLGDTFPLAKIRERLRCERCNARQAVVTFLAPDRRGGSIVHLFEDPPNLR